MLALNRAPRGTSRVGAILISLFLIATLLPGAVLAAGETLTFTTQPAGATGGVPFATQPVVTINPANAGGTVSLAIGTNPSGGTLSGCASPAYDSGTGTFTFSGCKIDKAGTGYTLVATWSVDGTVLATSSAFNVTVGPAAKLAFGQQPTNAQAATAISPAVTVLIQDAGGNLTTSTASVTMAIGTNPGGGTLSGTTTVAAVAGTATFSNLSINKTGTGYTLVASSAGLTSATSAPFNITPGPASKLGFTTQPARGVPGIAFAVQPIVAVQDAQGNTVTSDNTTVITLTASSGFLTCSGTTSRTVSAGLATFSGCSLPSVGVGITLNATSSPSYTPATSNPFDVADRLVFTTQPSNGTAGVALPTQPVVEVRAGSTTKAINDNGTPVTLSIASGPAGATLTCSPNPVTAAAGVVSFFSSGCKLDKAGTYTLLASAPNLVSATSAAFTIAAGPAAKLGFTAQPNAATANQPFPIQPVVAVQDLGGNTVTTGVYSTATVTLAIGTNPAGGTLTCTGGLTKAAVAGVATFTGCQINNAGVGYTLTATTTGLTGATSTPFTVSAPVASITLTTSASVITWGSGIVLNVQFGLNGAGKTFQLQGTRDGVNWSTIATLTTDASGRASFAYRPPTNLYYRAVFAGTPDLQAATSATIRTVVRQIALLRPTNNGAVRFIARNTSITFTTTVRPARPELAPAKVSFYFYRKVSGAWTLAAKRDVYIDAAGLARTTFKFSTSGQWYVRTQANPTPYNANSVMSPLERYNVG